METFVRDLKTNNLIANNGELTLTGCDVVYDGTTPLKDYPPSSNIYQLSFVARKYGVSIRASDALNYEGQSLNGNVYVFRKNGEVTKNGEIIRKADKEPFPL